MRKKEFKTDLYELEVYENGRIFNKTLNKEQPTHKLNTGHLYVSVKVNGKFVPMLVHRLVYSLFNDDISDEYIVHHKDGNKYNNSIDNLVLMKQSEHARLHQQKYFDKTMVCPICGKEFLWTALQQQRFYSHKSCKNQKTKHQLGTPVCSRKCQGLYGKFVQNSFSDCTSTLSKAVDKIECEEVSTGNKIIFNNRNEAIQYLIDKGISKSAISIDAGIRRCLRGGYKSSFGFKWKLV